MTTLSTAVKPGTPPATKDVRLCSHRPVLRCSQGRSRAAEHMRADAHSERVSEETELSVGPGRGGSEQTPDGVCHTAKRVLHLGFSVSG